MMGFFFFRRPNTRRGSEQGVILLMHSEKSPGAYKNALDRMRIRGSKPVPVPQGDSRTHRIPRSRVDIPVNIDSTGEIYVDFSKPAS